MIDDIDKRTFLLSLFTEILQSQRSLSELESNVLDLCSRYLDLSVDEMSELFEDLYTSKGD